MKFGDTYICRFPFTSGTISKPRPALVLFDFGSDVVICRITSVLHTGRFDVVLSNWSAAGLAKPSVVRVNRLVTAEKSLLHASLGSLSKRGEDAVRGLWNASMQL